MEYGARTRAPVNARKSVERLTRTPMREDRPVSRLS